MLPRVGAPRLLSFPFALAGVLAALVPTSMACGSEDELPEIFVVRPFTLTDQTGAPFDSTSLRGHTWIANFMFTSCTSICPLLTTHVANLQRRLADTDVRFVSITVDPEVDTPAVLSAYAERYAADPHRWSFLTGPREDVRRVVVENLHASMGEAETREAGFDIAHSGKLLLVDGNGVVRGQYDTDRAGLEAIERDARRLTRTVRHSQSIQGLPHRLDRRRAQSNGTRQVR